MSKHYAGELESIKATLGYDDKKEESIKLSGMRIALTTQLHSDAVRRRRDLIRNLILTALSGGKTLNLEELAESISASLHLTRIISEGYFQSELAALLEEGLIETTGHSYYLSEFGKQSIEERTIAGSNQLLLGQQAVRNLVADLTGYAVDSQEFTKIWAIFIDGITSLFLTNGIYVVDSIASIIEDGTTHIEQTDLYTRIKEIGEQIASLYSPKPASGGKKTSGKKTNGSGNRIREIGQSFVDLFSEKDSSAFKWIESICATFIDICSLGLEPTAQSEIALRLKEIELLLDTDVVLSLLAEGEPNHRGAVTIVNGWQEIGGRIYVTQSVLEEAAYHAWISANEYQKTWKDLKAMSDAEAARLLDNVFVRTFRKISRTHELRRWQNYIQAFKGENRHDTKKLARLLKESYRINIISEKSIDTDISQMISQKIISTKLRDAQKAGHLISILTDKSDRDGKLVATLDFQRKVLEESSRRSVIVSSSRTIRFGCSLVAERLGPPDPVISLNAVAWLLSLLPGAHLSLTSLRGILFDPDLGMRLPPVELQALRVIQASEEYELHWSRRGTLVDAIREKVSLFASQRNQSVDEVREALLEDTDEARTLMSEVVASTVDQIASSKSEKRIQQLVQENEALKKKLDEIELKRSTPSPKRNQPKRRKR